MTRKLSRRGIHVSTELYVDDNRTARVADVMTTDVETIGRDSSIRAAADRLRSGGHHALPLG